MIWSIIVIVATIFNMEDFFSTFLKEKNKKLNILIWGGYFLFHLIIMKRIQRFELNMLGNLCALIIVCCLIYQATFWLRSVMVLLAVSLSVISENIIAVLLFMIKGNINGDARLYSLLAKIIFWLCVRLLSMMQKGKMERIQWKKYGVLLAITASCNIGIVMIIYNISVRSTDEIVRSGSLIFTFLLLILDIVSFRLYTMYEENRKIEEQKKEYAYQIKAYDKQVSEKTIMTKEIRKAKHDMKNNMIYLQELLKNNPEEAKEYLNEYIGSTFEKGKEFAKSGNLPVDAILNYKYMDAVEKGINIELQMKIPDTMPYKSSDLCVVLGNLLDNAIEAVEKNQERKEIYLSLVFSKNRLMINIKNHYEKVVKKDRMGNYISQKAKRQDHGIGLKSVKEIVYAYNGIMRVDDAGKIFEVSILM